jgi:hypothetical protein
MSLHFRSRPGYFSVVAGRWWTWLALAALAGCTERERLTFPVENPGDGVGPFTTITQPLVSDTAVTEGDLLVVTGYSVDHDGVDTVYFEADGAGQSFAPFPGEGADSVPFAFQLSTIGISGASILVRAYAVDKTGDFGSASVRSIRIE